MQRRRIVARLRGRALAQHPHRLCESRPCPDAGASKTW
jgi:hypothetical protein